MKIDGLICRETYPLNPRDDQDTHPYLELAKWTNQGHGLIAILDHDIYYMTDPTRSISYRVSDTAIPGVLFNGVPDWLYEGTVSFNSFIPKFHVIDQTLITTHRGNIAR